MDNYKFEVKSFINIINSYLKQGRSLSENEALLDSLELFLYKFPEDFCDYIKANIFEYSRIKKSIRSYKSPFTKQSKSVSSEPELVLGVKKLIKSLEPRGGIVIFVLHDGAILQECFDIVKPKNLVPFSLRVSRKDLGYSKDESFKRYLQLFSIINTVADTNFDLDWSAFLIKYSKALNLKEKNDLNFKKMNQLIVKNIERKIPNIVFQLQTPITVVDTGLQGTFAIYLCWLFKHYKKASIVDFKLVSCYPWLPSFFQNRQYYKKIKNFPIIESSVMNTYSKSLPFFGRVMHENNFKIERSKLTKILNEKK